MHTAENGSDGAAKGLDPNISLVILDVQMPEMDGFEVARFLRANSNVPILMLTSKSDVESRVSGLDAGADDYLTKPFNISELCARVRSILRRSSISSGDGAAAQDAIGSGDWTLDRVNLTIVPASGAEVALTEREFMILSTLIRRAGSTVSRDELMRQVAGRQWSGDDRSLDVHISRLRKKLKSVSDDKQQIQTIRGQGFRFVSD